MILLPKWRWIKDKLMLTQILLTTAWFQEQVAHNRVRGCIISSASTMALESVSLTTIFPASISPEREKESNWSLKLRMNSQVSALRKSNNILGRRCLQTAQEYQALVDRSQRYLPSSSAWEVLGRFHKLVSWQPRMLLQAKIIKHRWLTIIHLAFSAKTETWD